jgi:hypothetical protein
MFKIACITLLFLCSAVKLFSQKRAQANPDTLQYVEHSFFISKQNGLYGLGDSLNHWLDKTPTGDTIFHVQDYHFAVRGSDQLYTIYDGFLTPVAENVSEVKEFREFVLLKEPKGWTIFPSDYQKNAVYYDSITVRGSHAWLYKKGKQGLLTAGIQEQLIPAEYDKIGPFYDGVLLLNNGKLGWKGPFSIPVNYDHIYQERPDVMAAKNSMGTVYYSYSSNGPLLTGPSDSVVFYDRYYKRVRGKQQSIFRIRDNSLVAEISGEQIHPYSFSGNYREETGYCIVGRDSACALYKNGKMMTGFDYDNILGESSINPPFFRVTKHNAVGVIDEHGKEQLKAGYTDILGKWNDYYLVRRGSKIGLVTKGDSVVLPCEYVDITFCNNRYLYLSKDGTYYGLYNYVDRKEISPYKYRNFSIDSTFIIARQETALNDIYYKDTAVFKDVYDAESNGKTTKGYKKGKIYIGAVRKGIWESYEYEIPSYTIQKEKERRSFLHSDYMTDIEDTYDYASGKWGVFSFKTGRWNKQPLAHGGNNPNGSRILDFPTDTTITWQGISFHSQKQVSPIDIAWDLKSKYNWIDVANYSYTPDYEDGATITVSPICYKEPGVGKSLDNYNSKIINTGFAGNTFKSVLMDGGRVKVSNYGQISLSEFYSQMSACGNIHPASLKDYESIIDPSLFISISGGIEHVLHQYYRNRHISVNQSFEWTDKENKDPLICRVAGKYGLLPDSGIYILKPEYESINPVDHRISSMYVTGVRSNSYKVYYPESKTYSKEIPQLLSFNGPYFLVQADSMHKAVLDHRLDTLLLSTGIVRLMDDSSYTVQKEGITTIYKNRKLLFSHNCDTTKKINEGHYLIYGVRGNFIMSAKGDTIYKSAAPVTYTSLGTNYMLDGGNEKHVFDMRDNLVCSFGKELYLVTTQKDLIVKDKESVVLVKKNASKQARINGRFVKATKGYVISKSGKTKSVYSFSGEQFVTKAVRVKAINDRYFSYLTGKKFMLYDTQTGEKRRIERLGVSITKEGLEYDESDEEDDSTEVVETIEDSYKVVHYRGKYGLKKDDQLILPYSYFHIQKTDDVFLVQDKIDYKLYDLRKKKFITEESYQKVYPYKDYFQVLQDGKLFYIRQ